MPYSCHGSAAVTVTSTGNITTAGTSARDCAPPSRQRRRTVTSTGNITTRATTRAAFTCYATLCGAVTVTSTGNITTAGTGAFGIGGSLGPGSGAVTVTSTGNITTPSPPTAPKRTGFLPNTLASAR